MVATLSPPGPLVERFLIRLPDGRDFPAAVYRTPGRHSGRRIVVLDPTGDVVCDTGDRHDLANARAELELWLVGEGVPATQP